MGLALSHWMVDGDPGADVWAMDVARYGDWATLAYTNAKVRENYSRRFRIRFPNEELPRRGRCAPRRSTNGCRRSTPCSATTAGSSIALWFAPSAARGGRGGHVPPLQRARARGRRVPRGARGRRAARDLQLRQVRGHGPGCRGSGCRSVMANRVPAVGRIALTPMLNERGKLIGDFTMCRSAEERFFLIGTYAAEIVLSALVRARPCRLRGSACGRCAMEYVGLSIAGPRSRELLQTLVR